MVNVVIERSEVDGKSIVHWFLRHREGWMLHFNDQYTGGVSAIQALQGLLRFSIPEAGSIASAGGEGTLVWSAT